MARPSADRLEREAENNATYYGSTTTSATPAIPRRPAPAAPAVIPGEDFSEAGAYRRAFNEVSYQSSQDYYADFPSTNPTTNPRAISAIMRYRKANATKLIFSQIPATLERYPSLVTALAEADFDENDAKRLINLAEMDTAFDAITSTEDPMRQRNIVVSMNPVQRAAFFDFFMAKAEELQREAAQNPSWAESAWNGFYGAIVEPIFDGLLFANETAQRTARAAMLAAEDNPVGAALGATPLGVANTAVMVSAYWDQAGPGMYDQEYIDGLKGEFGAAPVDTLLRLEELKRDGEPDPYGRWVSEYVGTDQETLVRDVTWSKYADPEMLQLARLINTASQDNTGMVLLSNLPEDFRDNAIYDLTAGAANVVAAFALDPTIVGAKVLQSYRAARYSLLKLSSAPGIDDAFRYRRTRLFYDSLGDDFARLENLTPQKRAVARDTIRRQRGNYLPPQVIDEMEAAGVRSADDAHRWFTSKYTTEGLVTGKNVGDSFGTTFEQMWRATNLAKRSPLMPGKTTAGVIRSRFRLLAAIHNPVNTRFAAGFAQRFDEAGEFIPGSTLDASAFGSRLSDDAFSYGAEQGAIPRRGPLGDFSRSVAGRQPEEAGKKTPLIERAGAALGYRYADKSVQARLDRISRRFARAPMPSAVYMNDGRDAGMIYDWSRVFLTRQDAALVSDIWRSAPNQAVRKQIFNGLVKTHAAAKGVTLRDPTKSWREFLPEVKRGGIYSPTLTMRRREDGLLVWDRGEETASLSRASSAPVPTITVSKADATPIEVPGAENVVQAPDGLRIFNVIDREQLPDTLYHVTTNADGIYGDGLIRVSQARGGGLGGGGVSGKDAVSLTTSVENAERIADQLRFYAATRAAAAAGGTTDDLKVAMADEWVRLGGRADDAELAALNSNVDTIANVPDYYNTTESVWVEVQREFFAEVQNRFGVESAVIIDQQALSTLDAASVAIVRVPRISIPENAVVSDVGYLRKGENGEVRVYSEIPVADSGLQQQTSKTAFSGVEDIVSIRPSVFDGQEYPLHLWQTSDFVKIPSFVDIEQAGVKASFLGAMFGVTQGQVAQKIVDGWSLLNLAGPRYFLRNALEDYVFYAMTAGQWKNVYKGRRFASALRDVRGEKLGIVNRQFRGKARPIDDPDFRTKWDLIKSNFTEEDRVAAMTAMRDGDLSKIRDLVALSMARTKLTGWTQANQDDLMDFVTEHGAKLLDEVNETAMYGTSAMFPTIQSTSYQVLVDPSDGAISARIVRPSRKWGDVSPNSDNPLVLSSWLRDIQGVADLDGVIGKIAILGLPESDDVLIPRIAQAIRDDKQFKYTERLAAFHTAGATPEAFAARYIADVRNMFSKPDGSLNSELRSKVIALDPKRGAVVRGADLTVKDLAEIGFRDRPQFVLGRAAADGDEVATLNSIKGFDKLWSIMGAQYARISREPIFLANYLEQRTLLRPYEETMAGMFGSDVAKARASKMATDRAYELTLSYTDNPRNRTLLAWNSRNVARYYRATEDFARRALRVGKNYPEGFWKVGLTYDVLEDTGFVFTDENNEDYFVFPGTELAIGLVNKAIQMHPRFQGSGVLQMDSASYEMRGNVRMLSPSADVQQWLPTYSSPISAIAIKSIIAAFPAFESFEQALLGDYSEGADFWRSVLPGHANRAWSAMDRNERYSSYSSTFKDAVQVSAAAGAMPGPDAPQEEWDKYSSGLDVLVTTLLVTRAVLGLGLPAAPKLTANDVTDFARSGGILNMDAAFREMIRVAQAEGSQNPFADGIVKYVETFGLDSVPYSLSTTESNDRFGSLNDLSSVSATEEGEKWVKEHGDLTSGRFKTAAAWLMPRMGKYSTDQATWLRKAGYKIPSTYSDIFEKARIVEGRYVMLQNREAAETDISAAKKRYYDAVNVGNQAAIEESWAEVRTLEDSWQDIQKQIKGDYPALESFGTTTEAIELNNESRKRLLDIEIRPMIEFIMNDREKDIPPGTENMQDAIATFDLYAGAISMIEGTTSAEDLDKRMMKIEAEQLLLEIGARDPNTQFFVDVILIPILARTYVPPTGGS